MSALPFAVSLGLLAGCAAPLPPRTPEPDVEALLREAAKPSAPNAPYGPRLGAGPRQAPWQDPPADARWRLW